MEAIGIIGMIFAIAALNRITKLKQQFSAMKKQLENAGVMKD